MSIEKKQKIFEQFAQYITSARKEKIQRVAAQRTKRVVVVLEDIFQTHNISAVLRSCDCFGIQEVYVIEQKHKYVVNEHISKGASGWLDIYKYATTAECFEVLKAKGYKIIATTPHENDTVIGDLSIDTPLALIFGNEETGLSDYALQHADGYVKIPMYGFTESFNISVCTALCLYEITKKLRESSIHWQMSKDEILDLQLDWLSRTTNRANEIAQQLINK